MEVKPTLKYVNDYKETAAEYASMEVEGTVYLGYRDIPNLIKEHVINTKSNIKTKWNVLDYGCGTGRSTRFLKKIGFDFEIDGIDINKTMLEQAKKYDSEGIYLLTTSGKIPAEDNYYDFVFSSFVLFEIPSKHEMKMVLKEISRVLKLNGIFIAVTGTTDLYDKKNNWISCKIDFPENENPESGSVVKVHIREIDITINDIYWTEADYEEIFKESDFIVINKIKSLGKHTDGIKWASETKIAPFVTYVLQKINNH